MQVQASHQLHPMIFHSLGADFENVRDLFGVLAFGDELENFALAGRQLFEWTFLVGDFNHGSVGEKSRGCYRKRISSLVQALFQSRLRLFGPRLSLLCSDFGLFGPGLRLLGPGLGLLRACLCRFGPGLGLLGSRLRLLGAGFRLLNSRLVPGFARRLIPFFFHGLASINRARQP